MTDQKYDPFLIKQYDTGVSCNYIAFIAFGLNTLLG